MALKDICVSYPATRLMRYLRSTRPRPFVLFTAVESFPQSYPRGKEKAL